MSLDFARCFNGIQTSVAAPYTPGSGVLDVVPLPASVVLPAGDWLRVTTLRNGVVLSILKVTAITTHSRLFVAGAIEDTADVPLIVGDAVRMYITAGSLEDIHYWTEFLLGPYSPVTDGQIGYDDGTGYKQVDPANLRYDAVAKTLIVNKLQVGASVAADPGTATGTDAATINAIVTILRNAGLCS